MNLIAFLSAIVRLQYTITFSLRIKDMYCFFKIRINYRKKQEIDRGK